MLKFLKTMIFVIIQPNYKNMLNEWAVLFSNSYQKRIFIELLQELTVLLMYKVLIIIN
jgi:hypothetical protein